MANYITVTAEYKTQHPQINEPLEIRVNLEKLRNRIVQTQKITKSIRLIVMLLTPYCEYKRPVRPITLSTRRKCENLIFIITPKRAGEHELNIQIYHRRCMTLVQRYKATLEVK